MVSVLLASLGTSDWSAIKIPLRRDFYCRKFGAGDRSRTRDLLITNQLLYQLSYASAFEEVAILGN